MNVPTIALDVRLAGGSNTGDSTYWSGLLHGLAINQPNVQLLLFSNKIRPETIPQADNFRWIQLNSRRSRWWSLFAFPLKARNLGAQAIHTQYSLSPLVGDIGVTTIHDVSFFIGPEWFGKKDRLILQSSVPSSARRAKSVITVSHQSKTEIEKFIPGIGDKTFVTYNACPPWIQKQPRELAQASIKKSLGIDYPFILTVGTRWPRKNMALAVKAVEGLPSTYPHNLLITGSPGWGEESLGSRSKASGYVSNEILSDLYSAADLYLAPSRHEGFGVPVLEAFRCGCPVLSSMGGALPEVVGDAGAIQPSWEPEAWTASIAGLLSDSSKLEDLKTRGFRREASFTWEQMAKETVDVYLRGIE